MAESSNTNSVVGATPVEGQRQCSACAAHVAEDAKFCSSCGQPLAAQTSSALLGERRLATVLMSDLRAYTQLNESLDPEDVASIMGQIKDAAGSIIESYGGKVNQFVGDEVIALFGIPVTHGDDAVRAISAARALHEFVRDMNSHITIKLPQPLSLHSGIQTGLVVAEHRDHRDGVVSATGDTLNTASRLLSNSGDDEILIGPATQTEIAPFYSTKSVGQLSLKGKAGLLEAFLVLEPTHVTNRFEAAKTRGFTPLTGRTTELNTLYAALEQSKDSSRIVEVIGDAGVGKSRICHALFEKANSQGFTLLQGRCQSTGRVLPYQPFAYALARWMGVLGAAQSEETISKVVRALGSLTITDSAHIALLLKVLSINSSEYPVPPEISSDQLPEQILEVIAKTLGAIAKTSPIILYLEDWHWADEASIGLLPVLTRQLAEESVMVLIDHRPEVAIRWAGQDVIRLELHPLGREAIHDLMTIILSTSEIQSELVDLIYKRAQGNPLFIEEICASLERQGMLEYDGNRVRLSVQADDINIPSTVEALVHSRIDQLAAADRDVLRIAAVIGPRVPLGLLQQVVANPAALQMCMVTLQDLGFLRSTTSNLSPSYSFRHAIIQEVAYQSLLLRERTKIHERIAQTIEELHRDTLLPEHIESLAHHYHAAGNHIKTLEFSERAASYAIKSFALAQARHHLETALDATDQLGDDHEDATHRQISLAKRWAEVNLFGPSVEQITRLEHTMKLAALNGDYASAGLFRYWISWVYYAIGHQKNATPILEEMAVGIRATGDADALAPVLLGLGHAYTIARDTRALSTIQEGLELRENQLAKAQLSRDSAEEVLLPGLETFSQCQIALLESLVGDKSAAMQRFKAAMASIQQIEIKSTEASNWITYGLGCIVLGEWEAAIECSRHAHELGEHLRAHYHLDMSDYLEGYSLFKLGNKEAGKLQVERAIANLESTGAQLAFSLVLAGYADLLFESGNYTQARVQAEKAAACQEIWDRLGLDLALRVLHRVDLVEENLDSAALRRRELAELAKKHESERESILLDIEELRATEDRDMLVQKAAPHISKLREVGLEGLAKIAEESVKA